MEILRRYSRFASLAPQNDMFLEMSTGPSHFGGALLLNPVTGVFDKMIYTENRMRTKL
jgi:hypothetical protein